MNWLQPLVLYMTDATRWEAETYAIALVLIRRGYKTIYQYLTRFHNYPFKELLRYGIHRVANDLYLTSQECDALRSITSIDILKCTFDDLISLRYIGNITARKLWSYIYLDSCYPFLDKKYERLCFEYDKLYLPSYDVLNKTMSQFKCVDNDLIRSIDSYYSWVLPWSFFDIQDSGHGAAYGPSAQQEKVEKIC